MAHGPDKPAAANRGLTEPAPFVSRGGLKLAAALDAFAFEPRGMICADLGCNVGGFTDCLLQRGAKLVYAVDTGYGQLAWKLRNDARVTVLERTNALYFDPWAALPNFIGCDLVVLDLGWTRQSLALPAARRWLCADNVAASLASHPGGRIISLIKPHYEATAEKLSGRHGVLEESASKSVMQSVLGQIPALGFTVMSQIRSPIRGGAGKGRAGNIEYLAMIAPA